MNNLSLWADDVARIMQGVASEEIQWTLGRAVAVDHTTPLDIMSDSFHFTINSMTGQMRHLYTMVLERDLTVAVQCCTVDCEV